MPAASTETLETAPCKCGAKMESKCVDVTLTSHRGLVVVEDVPVRICEECQEQYYDEEVSMKLQRLISRGFPQSEMVREVIVPVYKLAAETGSRVPESFK